jgi:hypothetical protein
MQLVAVVGFMETEKSVERVMIVISELGRRQDRKVAFLRVAW